MDQIAVRETKDGVELAGLVHGLPDCPQPFRVWFRFSGLSAGQVECSGNPFVPALLGVAMWLRRPVEIESPVSPLLLEGAARIMRIWHGWSRSMRPVEIRAGVLSEQYTQGREAACLFTGGVDSFHTLTENLATETGSARVTHLLFLGGQTDMALGNDALYRARCGVISEIAEELQLGVIFGATNVRDILPGWTLEWGVRAGSNVVAPSLCLSPLLDRVFTSASFTYDAPFPWGCHPFTDPLWNTARIRFEHRGCEVARDGKVIQSICRSATALRYLKVCNDGEATGYNCGRCEKCLRTMIALRAVGALDRCRTLPHEIPLDAVARLNACVPITRIFMVENLDRLRRTGADPRLEAALASALKPNFWRRLIYILTEAAYRLDRALFQGNLRSRVIRQAKVCRSGPELRENPARWLFARMRDLARAKKA
ncbi:MAG TPA: hypothetical protein VHD76_19380 [Bryobacteraceae bacterium]|nr:hypothetical protein [Bryobacteraceae bacterium]